jgi:hypothetical protein
MNSSFFPTPRAKKKERKERRIPELMLKFFEDLNN